MKTAKRSTLEDAEGAVPTSLSVPGIVDKEAATIISELARDLLPTNQEEVPKTRQTKFMLVIFVIAMRMTSKDTSRIAVQFLRSF
jgi:hypothetical protein